MTFTVELVNQIYPPHPGETPCEYADRLGKEYAKKASSAHKKELGQFFTPVEIARFMAESVNFYNARVKILDPGCGMAILSAALAESLILSNPIIASIELVAFETDTDILPFSEASLNYLRDWLQEKGVRLIYFLCKNDFILHNSHLLASEGQNRETYDLIVSNPPYFKLSKDDNRFKATNTLIPGQTNIYTIFMMISAKLLGTHGKLVFITPRSFCSGSYFRVFREKFFGLVDIQRIHLFESRTDAFKKDKVLQETLIITGVSKPTTNANQFSLHLFPIQHNLIISSSEGIADIGTRNWMQYPWSELVDMQSEQKIIYLPSKTEDDVVIAKFRTWSETFESLGIGVSTGKVVDFRNEELAVVVGETNSVPFIHLHNVHSMQFTWPTVLTPKGKTKPQYFIKSQSSEKILVDNKNYVLLRRFSSKDDQKKLIAAPFLKSSLPKTKSLAIENHLNYIYKINGEFSKNETLGVAAILNSELFDRYFRTFNGNINVSATELRNIKLPSMVLIEQIGSEIARLRNLSSKKIDEVVNRHLNT